MSLPPRRRLRLVHAPGLSTRELQLGNSALLLRRPADHRWIKRLAAAAAAAAAAATLQSRSMGMAGSDLSS